MCLIFFFCHSKLYGKNYLEQVSTLDLVAVLGGGKLLHVLAVLVGHHDGGHGGQAGVEASIRGHGANVTGNSLKTLLRLNNSLVHVHHSLNSIDRNFGIINSLSLPSDAGEGDIGGEEEEEAEEGQEGDDDGGEVKTSLSSSSIRWGRSSITLNRSSIRLSRSSISILLRSPISVISPDSGPVDNGGGEHEGSGDTLDRVHDDGGDVNWVSDRI